jgi:hypothetical protein
MALSQFASAPLSDMISHLAERSSLTVVIGAGVSVEAGLPTWNRLVADLLERAGRERLGLTDDAILDCWTDHITRGESPLGAAAVAEALAGDDLADWIPDALYGGDASRFQPGPIARQLPVLREAYGPSLQLLTTNYDDLVEQAFADAEAAIEAATFSGPSGPSTPETDSTHQRVSHLHGFLARDGRNEGQIVLTERDYQALSAADWQSGAVGGALLAGSCVFIGSSLTDPNLLRYLHTHTGSGSPQHYAIFTRQDAYPSGTPIEVVRARENALVARWRASNLEIVFVDYYAEIASALSEIARAKREGALYTPLPDRLSVWHALLAERLLLPPDAFDDAQELVHGAMRILLESAIGELEDVSGETVDEVLAATLWLVDAAGNSLTNWSTTDRVHRDPATIDPVPIDEHSNWVAVRSFCRGTPLGEPRDNYASRWHFIRGLPIVTTDGIPAGAVTISSMCGEDQTVLSTMSPTVEAAFDRTIHQIALDILDLVSEGTD